MAYLNHIFCNRLAGFCLLGLVLCMPIWGFGMSWEASFKNRQYFHYNSVLYLGEVSNTLMGKKVSVTIRMREQGHPFYSFQKNMEWLIGLQPISVTYYRFSRGNYEVFIDIYCSETGETSSLKYDYACIPLENGLHTSDIFLDYQTIPNLQTCYPILGEKVDEKNEYLYFYQEINAPKSVLTARAILYQEKPSKGNINATTYGSLSQINQILAMKSGRGTFVGNFELSKLLAGKYLIEILIYADAELLAEKSVRFEIVSEETFLRTTEIDNSIANLLLLCTPEQIAKISALSSSSEKKQALLRVFEQRYPNEGLLQADVYFAKIKSAQQRFGDEVDFWGSARVQTFLRYGEPDGVERLVGGVEKWRYKKWDLLFFFEKRGMEWVGVER